MSRFADTMRPPTGGAVRDGVISDLARYYQLTPEQVIHRCLHWEDDSVKEWQAASVDTPGGLAEFYNTVTSWSFDLLWCSYLQTVRFAYPKHVVVADLVWPGPSWSPFNEYARGNGDQSGPRLIHRPIASGGNCQPSGPVGALNVEVCRV